jgi:hypothetical protein
MDVDAIGPVDVVFTSAHGCRNSRRQPPLAGERRGRFAAVALHGCTVVAVDESGFAVTVFE